MIDRTGLEGEPSELKLSELLGSLSLALDMTEGQPEGHCIRSCWIGLNIGRRIGLDDHGLWELYYTLLLKDLGCSSNAARICQLYLTDDLGFKRESKTLGDSLPQVLRFVLRHTGLKAGMAERFRAILNIMRNGGEIVQELIETRCQRGAEIARQLRFSEDVALGIHGLDEHWNGGGLPSGLAGTDIPLYARIALIAQVVDVFHTAAGPEAAREEVLARAGSWFDPDLVEAFGHVATNARFWSELRSPDLAHTIFALEPAQGAMELDEDYLDDIAAAYARVVDSKSSWTSGHSTRVALFSDLIAEVLGFSPERRRWLKRGALLHDIGKLGVSNQVLDKPGKLDDDEFAAVKRHTLLGETILGRISAFRDLAALAVSHHERLDGHGYPRGLKADEIGLETRIITTADIFDALTAERPYRGPMPVAKALGIMHEQVGSAIDPTCLAALETALAVLDESDGAVDPSDNAEPLRKVA